MLLAAVADAGTPIVLTPVFTTRVFVTPALIEPPTGVSTR
jgi:hypothetical protein